jgi:Outer membrane protein beta-barrel domain
MQFNRKVKMFRDSFVFLPIIYQLINLIFGLLFAYSLMYNRNAMKKITIIISVLILLASTLKAQEGTKPFNFTFRMGPNLSSLKTNSDAVSPDGSIIGFSWGALCEIPVQTNYALVTGFNINFAGGMVDYAGLVQGQTEMVKERYSLKYLELPLMLKIKTNEVNGVLFYGQIGLGSSFRLTSRVKRTFQSIPGISSSVAIDEDKNCDNLTSFIRESLLIGIGAQYTLQNNLKLFGGLNFNNGFTDVLKKGPYNTSDPKVISNFVELNIGLFF